MPSDMARAVRLYHTPDMMKKALKDSWALNDHHILTNQSGHDHSFQISEEPDMISDQSLARQRSAVAKEILNEASKGSVFAWEFMILHCIEIFDWILRCIEICDWILH